MSIHPLSLSIEFRIGVPIPATDTQSKDNLTNRTDQKNGVVCFRTRRMYFERNIRHTWIIFNQPLVLAPPSLTSTNHPFESRDLGRQAKSCQLAAAGSSSPRLPENRRTGSLESKQSPTRPGGMGGIPFLSFRNAAKLTMIECPRGNAAGVFTAVRPYRGLSAGVEGSCRLSADIVSMTD